MENQEIMVEPQDFEDALRDFKSLRENFDKIYKKIVDNDTKLSAVFKGDAGNSFKTQSAIVEKVFAKNLESLNIILQSRLQYALDNITSEDLKMANLISGNEFNPLKSINSQNQLNSKVENRRVVDVKSGKVEKSETELIID